MGWGTAGPGTALQMQAQSVMLQVQSQGAVLQAQPQKMVLQIHGQARHMVQGHMPRTGFGRALQAGAHKY